MRRTSIAVLLAVSGMVWHVGVADAAPRRKDPPPIAAGTVEAAPITSGLSGSVTATSTAPCWGRSDNPDRSSHFPGRVAA